MQLTELRIGILGAGRWGRNLVRAFQTTPRARVVAICDSTPSRLHELGNVGPSVSLVGSVDDVIGRACVDAVVIATPPDTHAALASEALRAGHHVFVEKPMALSSGDATSLCQWVRESARKLMVGHILLYHPAVDELLRRIRAGCLGEIRLVRSRRFCKSPRSRREGAWWSLAPHDVSLMREIFGSHPFRISASGRPAGTSTYVEATMSFGPERTGIVEVGTEQADEVRLVMVVGTCGGALFDDRSQTAKLILFDVPRDRANGADSFHRRDGSSRTVQISDDEPLTAETRAFVEAVLEGHAIRSDAEQGHAVTSVLEIGAESIARNGVSLAIPPPVIQSVNLEGLRHGPRPFPLLALT